MPIIPAPVNPSVGQRPPTVILFGDSRTADCDVASGTNYYSTNMSWFDWGQAYRVGGPALDVVRNAGVAGNTTTQMLARIQADVLVYKPGYMTLWGGTNDSWTTTAGVDASYANMVTMMDMARQAGIYVFVISETTGGSSPRPVPFPGLVAYFNDRLRTYAASRSNVEFWDFNSVIVDPTSANGYAKSTMLSDGIHLSTLGTTTIAKQIVGPRLARLPNNLAVLANSQYDTQTSSSTSRNVAYNPLMQGTSGTVGGGHTGTLPTGWVSSSNVAALSIVARADGFGNDLKVILSATSTSSFFLTHTLTQARFTPGKSYVLEAALGIDETTQINAISLTCSLFETGSVDHKRGFGYPTKAAVSGDSLAVGDYIIRSRIFVAAGSVYTGANTYMRIGIAASNATATVRLGRFSIKQLD